MSNAYDQKKKLWRLIDHLKSSLRTHNLSCSFSIIDGPSLPESSVITPNFLTIGGIWDPLGQRYIQEENASPSAVYAVTPQQSNVLLDDSRFICVLGGQRSGKTEVGLLYALKVLLDKPGSIVFYLLPSFTKFSMLEEKIERYIRPFVSRRDIKHYIYELFNGSVLRIYSAESGKGESFLGSNADLFILEEFREMGKRFEYAKERGKKIFQDALSRLTDRNGKLTIISSPETNHLLEEISLDRHTQIFSKHKLDSTKNVFILNNPDNPLESFQTLKKIYDPNKYSRDVLGEFVSDVGKDYYNFDKIKHVFGPNCLIKDLSHLTDVTSRLWESEIFLSKDPRYYSKDRKLLQPEPRYQSMMLVGMDFGATQMNAIICKAYIPIQQNSMIDISKVNYLNTYLVVLKELSKQDTSTLDFMVNVLQPELKYTPSDKTLIICDPSGTARSHVDGNSSVEALRKMHYDKAGKASGGYLVLYKHDYHRRLKYIEAVRSRLQLDKILIHESCSKLIEGMENMQTLGKSRQAISRDPYGHLTDCLRYLVGYLFPLSDLANNPSYLNEVSKFYKIGNIDRYE